MNMWRQCQGIVLLAASTALSMLLTACAGLLPDAKNIVQGPWASFQEARDTFAKVVPYQTTRAELTGLGLDPLVNPNITILNYSDVIRRFVPPAGVDGYTLDPGVMDCIRVRTECQGYELDQKVLRRDRYGNFWLDFFNFNRKTLTSGWEFNAVWLMKGELVVYKLIGGKPQVREDETKRNPLGPLQGIDSIKLGN
jgi:hypothetical protein